MSTEGPDWLAERVLSAESGPPGAGTAERAPAAPKGFQGFGPCRWAGKGKRQPPGTSFIVPADARAVRRVVREHCPPTPGVYGMVDADGELVYVGKSKCLRNRLLSYFSKSAADTKAERIVEHTRRLLWEPAPHEFSALLRELELIRRWLPRFNVLGRPGRFRRAYICLGRAPAPYAYIAPRPSARDDALFGPLAGPGRWRIAVRAINHTFGLRDCPDRVPIVFSDQAQMFPGGHNPACMRHELGTCLAPCAAQCSQRAYRDRVRKAREFLAGGEPDVLERLEKDMRCASAARQFERAAVLRDSLTALDELRQQIARVDEAQRHYSFVYPLPAYGRGEAWYLIRGGEVIGAVPSPAGDRNARRCLEALDNVYRTSGPPLEFHDDLDSLLLVTAWFRARPEELQRTIDPDEAKRLCRTVTNGTTDF